MALILETPRLALREFGLGDYDDLCLMLRDAETMYAYEHAFSEAEAAPGCKSSLTATPGTASASGRSSSRPRERL